MCVSQPSRAFTALNAIIDYVVSKDYDNATEVERQQFLHNLNATMTNEDRLRLAGLYAHGCAVAGIEPRALQAVGDDTAV